MPTFTNAEEIFTNICMAFQPANAKGDNAVIQFDLSGEKGGKYWVKVADGKCESGIGPAPSAPNMTFLSSGADWIKLTNGELNAMTAFMQGKIKVQGNMSLALKFQSWFAR
jgi:putative sterol carrier protein